MDFEPGVEGILRLHFDEAGHVGMTLTTELAANRIGLDLGGGREPHRDLTTGDGILLNPHRHDVVVVDLLVPFGVRKLTFKQAVDALLKKRRIILTDRGMTLAPETDWQPPGTD